MLTKAQTFFKSIKSPVPYTNKASLKSPKITFFWFKPLKIQTDLC